MSKEKIKDILGKLSFVVFAPPIITSAIAFTMACQFSIFHSDISILNPTGWSDIVKSMLATVSCILYFVCTVIVTSDR